jgi:anti-sigma B factor antagonist
MTQTSLEALTRQADDTLVVELRGDIDGDAREALGAAYDVAGPGVPVLLDFGGVGYINSTGIAVIVGVLARARADARPVSAMGLSAHYREIFEVTRLSDFLTILPPTDEPGAAT